MATPTVTSLSLTSGPLAGGQLLITGTNFLGTSISVTFGGNSATIVQSTGSTAITVISPPGSAGTVDVIVTIDTRSSVPDTNSRYTYTTVPTITSLTPNSGPLAGRQMQINGFNFSTTSTNNTVTFGGVSGTIQGGGSSTQITVDPPAGTAGAVNVIVTVGGVNSNQVSYTYTTAPTITNGEQFKGFTNVLNQNFTIYGFNFSDNPTAVSVYFGGFPVVPDAVSTTNIQITLPTSTVINSVAVVVIIGGVPAASVNFTYYNKPTITSVTPNNGPITGNTPITIVGTNFLSDSLVRINGVNATNIVVNSALTQITCNTPRANAGGAGLNVTVAPLSQYDYLQSDEFTYTYNAVTTLGAMKGIAFSGLKGVGISDGDNGAYGLFYTTDGGQYWSPSNLSTASSNNAYSNTYVAIDGNNAIALCQSFYDAGQPSVYYSTNAGQTWTTSFYTGPGDPAPDPTTLSINGNGPAMAIRGNIALLAAGKGSGRILYSSNGGANWVDCNGEINDTLFSIQMASNGRAVAGSGNALYFIDNTLGWQTATGSGSTPTTYSTSMNDTGRAIYGSEAGLNYSTDYGATVLTSTGGPTAADGPNRVSIDASGNCIAIDPAGVLYRSNNAGQTWSVATLPADTQVFGPYALMVSGTRAIIGGYNTSLYSTNSGQTWSTSTTPISRTETGARFLAGDGGVISTETATFYTIDGGNNWVGALCFKEGTKILTDKGYVLIQDLRKGDLVKTVSSGFKKIEHIGYSKIHHNTDDDRVKDKLYRCPMSEYPELIEDLVITGGHSILVKEFKDDEQMEKNKAVFGSTPVIDDHFKLLAFIDDKTKIFEEEGLHTIWHFALENTDEFGKYGVYANGLLVETIDISGIFIKEYNMTLIE
jgi:photosystem II stability/assembly factor-like uncharacterized protein